MIKCPECGEKLSFDDYELWYRCLHLSDKQREKHDKMILAETKRLLKLRTREFNVSPFVKSFLYFLLLRLFRRENL